MEGKVIVLLPPSAWQSGCEKEAGKDPQLLGAANEAMLVHWGKQLGETDAQKTLNFVN